MRDIKTLKLCPFYGGYDGVENIGVSNGEGNKRNEKYESDPWVGLLFQILYAHEENKGCLIARYRDS